MKKLVLNSITSLSLLMTTACATSHNGADKHVDIDHLEGYNRAIFNFNSNFDKYVMKPIATGYREITNQFTRERISSALSNIKEPISVGNHLLQGNFEQSGVSIARFCINSTLGLLGMFDVAEGWGLEKDTTGFDETLAKWCVPDGPFVMLPFIGPSTPRAMTGLVADSVTNPVYWATYNDANIRDKVMYSYAAVQAVSLREANLDFLDELERGSVDFYSTMRSAYLQNRKKMGCSVSDNVENSYDFDFDEDI